MCAKSKLRQAIKISCLKLLEKLLRKKTLTPSDLSLEKIQRILIICHHDELQDLLLTTPVFRAVRQHFPKAHVSALASAELSSILLNNVYLDEVISGLSDRSAKNSIKFIKKLRANFDLVIVLNRVSHSFFSDVMAYFTGADYILGSGRLVIESCESNFFYNLRAPYPEITEHQTERNLDIVRYLGIDTKDFTEEVYLTKDEKNDAVAFLKEQKISPEDLLIAVHIGSKNDQDQWPVGKFVQVAKFFSIKHNAKILVSWGADQAHLGGEFQSCLPFKPIDVSDLNLRELASVLFFCNLMICHDSGVMHLAASVGIPVVSIFGRQDPHEWKPVGKQIIAIKGVDGRFSSISEDQVIQKSEDLLELFPKPSRLNFEDWDISDRVLKNYLNILGT